MLQKATKMAPEVFTPAVDGAGHGACFHCGLPVPPGVDISVSIDGTDRPMCCRGCEAAALMIDQAGLADYYRFRTQPAVNPENADEPGESLESYDLPAVRRQFVHTIDPGHHEAVLILEGIACPACAWLIECYLHKLPGVQDVAVNYANRRARVRFDPARLKPSALIGAVRQLGYQAWPYEVRHRQGVKQRERRTLLKQLGVAGVLGMQVMMITLSLYSGGGDLTHEYRQLLYMLELLLTAPVVLYSAQAFFRPAWRSLAQATLNMDVSVSLAILLAFVGSAWNTFKGSGEVYFDSVMMFVFLLLAARFLELAARNRSINAVENRLRPPPASAIRVAGSGAAAEETRVAVAELVPGDCIRVREGEVIPVDGEVRAGTSSVSEAMLTGESTPLRKQPGAIVHAGSINVESPLEIDVRGVGENTLLARIGRSLDQASADRPASTVLADRIAPWFVLTVLGVAVGCAAIGLLAGADDWFHRVLAVLVIACPCALSLAAPAAITNACATLIRRGVLVTRNEALERLERISHVVLDKTGTLTHGETRITGVETCSTLDPARCLRIAAALERQSAHPIARAFADTMVDAPAALIVNHPGLGIEGSIDGRIWYLGSPVFILRQAGLETDAGTLQRAQANGATAILLADRERIHCVISLADTLRPGARELVSWLHGRGIRTVMLTGDREAAARQIATATGIDEVRAELLPEGKLEALRTLQASGAVVAMLGDGVNDAPVLAGADVSVAMGSGAVLAQTQADIILLAPQLAAVRDLLDLARRTQTITRENLFWAVCYNLLAIPAAAFGWVSPLFAALGMSLSSLIVIGNALRLGRTATAA